MFASMLVVVFIIFVETVYNYNKVEFFLLIFLEKKNNNKIYIVSVLNLTLLLNHRNMYIHILTNRPSKMW